MSEENKTNQNDVGAGAVSKLLNALGALAVTVFTTMGLIYVLHGNFLLAGIFSILILVAIMLLSKILIDNKTKQKVGLKNTKGTVYDNNSSEFIILGLYTIVALVTLPFIFHYIDVDFSRKTELKTAGVEKTASINDLLTAYNDQVEQIKDELKTDAQKYLFEYKRDPQSSAKDNLMTTLGISTPPDIFRTYPNYQNTKEDELDKFIEDKIIDKQGVIDTEFDLGKFEDKTVAEHVQIYTDESKAIFNNWQMMKVSDKYYDIDNYYQKLYDRIVEKKPDFSYTKPQFEDMKIDKAFYSLTHASAFTYLIGILSFLLFHFLVLAEYIKTQRAIAGLKKMRDEDEDTTGVLNI